MKRKYKNMDEVLNDAEKTKAEEEKEKATKEQAFQKAQEQDTSEKLADKTYASAEEREFKASVDGNEVEVENKKEELEEQEKIDIDTDMLYGWVKGTAKATYNMAEQGTESLIGQNKYFAQSGAMQVAMAGTNVAAEALINQIGKNKKRDINIKKDKAQDEPER